MRTFFASVALVVFACTPVFADKLTFPKSGEAMFQITVPDSWSADTDDDEIVEATSPEENISLSIWKISANTKVETVANDLKDILKDYATDVKLDKDPEKIEVDGIPGLLLTGSGQGIEDEVAVGFIAFILVRGDDAAIVFFQLDDNMTRTELKKFKSILESIQVPE